MEFLLDTANINVIEELIDYLPISGVTTNPTIVKRESPKKFFKHMREIRNIIGPERTLHVQVVGTTFDQIVKDAEEITKEIDRDVYIKIPADLVGLKAIRFLKSKEYNITATAIYETLQSYLALESGADYIAPYVNRMQNLGTDPFELIYGLSNQIKQQNSKCKIVAASFKGLEQIRKSISNGAQAITADPELFKQIFKNPNIEKAVNDFRNDWLSIYADM